MQRSWCGHSSGVGMFAALQEALRNGTESVGGDNGSGVSVFGDGNIDLLVFE